MTDVPLEEMPESELWDLLTDSVGSYKAEVFDQLAFRHRERGEHLQSASLWEQSATENLSVDNFKYAAQAKYRQGMAFGAAEVFDQALDCFIQAAELDGKTGDQGEIAVDLKWAGITAFHLNDLKAAEEHLHTAERLFLAVDRIADAGESVLALGELLFRSDDFDAALKKLERARELLRQAHLIDRVAHVDNLRADVLLAQGRLDEAVELLQDCIRVAESTKGKMDDANAHRRLAEALLELGQAESALPHLERARDLFSEADEPVEIAMCDRSAAKCLRILGERESAENLLRGARAVFDAAGFDFEVFKCDVDLATGYHLDGEFRRAAALNQDLAERAMKISAVETAYQAVTRWGENLLVAGDAEDAIEVLTNNSIATDSNNDYAKILRLSVLALAYQAAGEIDQALQTSAAGLDLLPEEPSAFVKAACYEVRGLNAMEADPYQAERDLGHAIALYLGSGFEDRARELSAHFMPKRMNRELGEGENVTKPNDDISYGIFND
jgi:tetratricopeptide (TPR) repeat protein